MENNILPLTTQAQVLQEMLFMLNDLTVKGTSAPAVCAIRSHIVTLNNSVTAQIEYGKKLCVEQLQSKEKEQVKKEVENKLEALQPESTNGTVPCLET